MSCIVVGCKSHSSCKENDSKIISFHRFPSDVDMRQKWINAIARNNWEWKKQHRICSKHFSDDCFINIGHKWRRFPSDVDMRQKLINAIARNNWEWKKQHRICSKHFSDDCFNNIGHKWRRLKIAAVPSLHLRKEEFMSTEKPVLICREGEFRRFLEQKVPLLNERYWPTPWCVESRLQTVLGSVLRSRLLPPVKYRRQVLRLSDGGQLALDWLEGLAGPARAVLLVLPGLTGSADADYVRCVAAAAAALRARCVVYNNRGLGGLPLSTPRLYCAVSHADLAEAARAVRAEAGDVPLLAVGVSLGGLILGHYLAEHGEEALVHAAIVVSSPLDVIKGSECMESAPLNALLSRHMARQLVRTVAAHAKLREGGEEARVRAARSVREFDAAFTARHFGFASVGAYYRAATLRDKLWRVRRPLLCLCAADDPFQPLRAIPAVEARASRGVALAVTARGGHIGFLEGWWPARAAHTQYIARLTHQYFAALLDHPAPALRL